MASWLHPWDVSVLVRDFFFAPPLEVDVNYWKLIIFCFDVWIIGAGIFYLTGSYILMRLLFKSSNMGLIIFIHTSHIFIYDSFPLDWGESWVTCVSYLINLSTLPGFSKYMYFRVLSAISGFLFNAMQSNDIKLN